MAKESTNDGKHPDSIKLDGHTLSDGTPQGYVTYAFNGKTYTGFYKKIKNLNWYVLIAMDDTQINRTVLSSTKNSFLLTLLAILIGLLIGSILIYNVVKALYKIIEYATGFPTDSWRRLWTSMAKASLASWPIRCGQWPE